MQNKIRNIKIEKKRSGARVKVREIENKWKHNDQNPTKNNKTLWNWEIKKTENDHKWKQNAEDQAKELDRQKWV